MHRRRWSVACWCLLFAWAMPSPVRSAERPNIVVILCDDLGYADLSCFGHPHIHTPNLDRLANTGIRLTACYSAAPVCSPSRVGLMTGRSPNRAGVYDWIPPGSRVRPDAREQVHMRKNEVTIPALLRSAGYATCLTGKWHCNSQFNSTKQPQPDAAGFDHWFATQNNAAPSHENPMNFVRNGQPVGAMKGYSAQLVVDEAINWLERVHQRDAKQPFFLYCAFHEPHEPVASPKKLVDKYRSVARNVDEAHYFANVENVDLATGRLLSAIEKLGKRENTLVVFTSDNGPETLNRYRRANRSYGSPKPLRGMKLWTTEAGFRVAGIMSWPARLKSSEKSRAETKPRVSDDPVWSLDFLPTFCELAGAKIPKDLKFDGTSFLPLLDGKKIHRPSPLFWCYFNAINEQRVAMRHGPWKMLAKINGGKFRKMQNVNDRNIEQVRSAKLTDFELYRVTEDISEQKNVITEAGNPGKQLRSKLEAIYQDLAETSHHWTVRKAATKKKVKR